MRLDEDSNRYPADRLHGLMSLIVGVESDVEMILMLVPELARIIAWRLRPATFVRFYVTERVEHRPYNVHSLRRFSTP